MSRNTSPHWDIADTGHGSIWKSADLERLTSPTYTASLSGAEDVTGNVSPSNNAVAASFSNSFMQSSLMDPILGNMGRDHRRSVGDIDLAAGLIPVDSGRVADVPRNGYLSDSQLQQKRFKSRDTRFKVGRSSLGRSASLTKSAGTSHHTVLKHALHTIGLVAPGQPGKARRNKSKVLELDLDQESDETTESRRVHVTAYCIAFELDIGSLADDLRERFGSEFVQTYPEEVKSGQTPDMLHARYVDESGVVGGDVFCFDFGIVVAWDLTSGQEAEAVWQMAWRHAVQRLPQENVEVDELTVSVGSVHKTTIRNDTVALSRRAYDDVLIRAALSLALAQSTRISVQEAQVMAIVESTKDLPAKLMNQGHVHLPHRELAIAIGNVFLQKTALNLQVLSGHKETPKFFWGRRDNLQFMYHSMSDYLDLDERADILNRRLSALTEMLDLLRDQQCTAHEEHLEWIVIALIFITTCLGLLQITSLLGAGRSNLGGWSIPHVGLSAEDWSFEGVQWV